MRFYISLLILGIVFNKHVLCSDVNIPIDRVTDTVIHYLDEVIRHGNKAADPLDPIEFDRVEIKLPGEMFGANVNVTKGSLTGLSNFQILDMQISATGPKVALHILFPLLKFYSEYYEFDGHIFYVVPMGGRGLAHFEIHNAQFKGTLYLKEGPNSHSLLLDRLEDAEYNIERILALFVLPLSCLIHSVQPQDTLCILWFHRHRARASLCSFTEFDQNIDTIISAVVEDLLADYLNRFNQFIITTYSDTVIQYINNVLQKI